MPFGVAKQTVSSCKTDRFAFPKGPCCNAIWAVLQGADNQQVTQLNSKRKRNEISLHNIMAFLRLTSVDADKRAYGTGR